MKEKDRKTGRKGRRRSRFPAGMMLILLAAVLHISGDTAYADDPEAGFEKLYALVVSTGTSGGSSVGFFGITYLDENGNEWTDYIFPHEGDYEASYQMAVSLGKEKNKNQENLQEQGYSYAKWEANARLDGLGANTTDVYLCRTLHTVKSVEKILIYTDESAGISTSWTCSGIRFYKVTDINGVCMYGSVSEQNYIDFAGTLLAKLKLQIWKDEAGNENVRSIEFTCAKNDIFIVEPKSQKYPLQTDGFGEEGKKELTKEEEGYLFKFDLADVYGAGVEAFANASSDAAFAQMNLPEVLDLRLTYQDTYGIKKTIHLPVVTSAVSYAKETCKTNVRVADFAGQGESIVFSGQLPDCREIQSVKLSYGPKKAVEESGLLKKELSSSGESKSRDSLEKKIINENDTISIAGISIYKITSGQPVIKEMKVEDGILTPVLNEDARPVCYYTASSYMGAQIGVDKGISFQIMPYEEGAKLKPEYKEQRYLLVVDTAAVETKASAAKCPDISVSLSYTSTSGKKRITEAYMLEELSKDYYGFVPDETEKECAYSMGVAKGGRLYAMLSLNDVQTFNGAEFGLKNIEHEWQMSNFAIYQIDTLSARHAEWKKRAGTYFGQKAKVTYYRMVNGSKELLPEDALFHSPVTILLQNGESKSIDFYSKNVTSTVSTTNWMEDSRYSMSYDTAISNLGFYHSKVQYQVNVKVADNSNNDMEEGDSGSKNYFYFQLIFADGESAFVQANQQMESDGFLTGQVASFNILTNQDYGELKAVKIIPDDISESSDPYDKLNIEYIAIFRRESTGMSTTWTVDNVGWIGIDYKDDGETAQLEKKTRSMEEITRVYPVSNAESSVSIQFAVVTGNYGSLDGEKAKQFSGYVTADIGYIDTRGVYQTQSVDIVAKMYEYANKTAKTQQENGRRKSDPDWMFRENSTDRFICTMKDVEKLVDIRIHVSSEDKTVLNIRSISAAFVVTEGFTAINTRGEYEKSGKTLEITSNETTIPSFELGGKGSSVSSTVQFQQVEEDMISSMLNGTWAYVLHKEPISKNDYLKLFVYMEKDVSDYVLEAKISYTDIFGNLFEITKELKYYEGEEGGYYYIDREGANNIATVYSLTLSQKGGTGARLNYAVMQQIRNDVVLETYQFNFEEKDVSKSPTAKSTGILNDQKDGNNEQVLTLSFGDMPKKELVSETKDVAVALRYTSVNDPMGTEYISSYLYLTQQQYTEISGGMSIQLTYDIPYVKQITGIQVAATGNLSVSVDKACIGNYSVESTDTEETTEKRLLGWYSIPEGKKITNGEEILRIATEEKQNAKTVVPVVFTLSTSEDSTPDAGTEHSIRMIVNYTDSKGRLLTKTYDDIRNYTISGSYAKGQTAVVRILEKNIGGISSIMLEPYDDDNSYQESWKPKSVTVVYGDGMGSVSKREEAEIDLFIFEGSPEVAGIRNDLIVTSQYQLDGIDYDIKNGEESSILESGESVRIRYDVANSVAGAEVRAYEVIDDSRRDMTDTLIVAENIQDGTDGQQSGQTGEICRFVPPENTSGRDRKYRVEISSKENPKLKCQITFTVKAEAVPVEINESSQQENASSSAVKAGESTSGEEETEETKKDE